MNGSFATDIALAVTQYVAASSLIFAVAWITVWLMRRSSAAARHAVWAVAFGTVAVLPLLDLAVPGRRYEVPNPGTPLRLRAGETAMSTVDKIDPSGLKGVAAPSRDGHIFPLSHTDLRSPYDSHSPAVCPGAGCTRSVTERKSSSAMFGASSDPLLEGHRTLWGSDKVTARVPTLWILMAIWMTGAAIGVGQLFVAYVRLRGLRSRRGSVNGLRVLTLDLPRLCALAPHQAWALRISKGEQPAAALTWGWVRSIVMLPRECVGWSSVRLDSVLMHELAHVRRFDALWRTVGAVVCAVQWFNPLVWIAIAQMRHEAEIAADDCVLASGVRASTYAEELLRIAEEVGKSFRYSTQLGVSMMNQSKLETRIQAILDPTRRRLGVSSLQVLAMTAIGASLLVPLVSLRPAFGQSAPEGSVTATAQKARSNAALSKARAMKAQKRVVASGGLSSKARSTRIRALLQRQKALANSQRMLAAGQRVMNDRQRMMLDEQKAMIDRQRTAIELEMAAQAKQQDRYGELLKKHLEDVDHQQLVLRKAEVARNLAAAGGRNQILKIHEAQRVLDSATQLRLKNLSAEVAKVNQDAASERLFQALQNSGKESLNLNGSGQQEISKADAKELVDRLNVLFHGRDHNMAHLRSQDSIARYKLDLSIAQAHVDVANNAFAQIKALYDQGAADKEEFLRVQAELQIAKVHLDLAQQIFDMHNRVKAAGG